MVVKKHLLSIVLLLLCVFLLASCGSKNEGKEEAQNVIWSPDITIGIISEAGVDWEVNDFFSDIFKLTGKIPVLLGEKNEPYDHEFVFGNTSREISKTAYKMLDRKLTGIGGEMGWLVYTDGSSLAVAFNSDYGAELALDYVWANYLTLSTFKAQKGVLASDVFMISEYAAQYREAERAKHFERLEGEVGKEITDEIRRLYSLYTDDIYVWLANLYDYEIGGFYFSNSGRDNEGYLPDIESTVQALSHLNSGGMFAEYGNSYAKGVSPEMREQLVNFAKSLQSPVDGFFYHPQWGEDIIDARRGRDLGWASQLLEAFGEKPLYNTPGGMKGELGAPPGVAPAASLSTRLGESAVSAVSKVIPAASGLPSYLRSLEAWAKYIDNLNLPNDSYVAGNTLAAQHNEIKAAGKEYVDYLINYLNETQIPDLGLWEEIKPGKDTDCDPNDRLNYANVNGLMKIASVYQYYNVPVPNLENALRSCIKVALYPNDEGDAHVCCTYNPWVIMGIVLNGAKSSEGEERVAELRAIIMENAADLIATTFDKLVPHVREDGCFSYFETITCTASQKAPVACSTTIESDVNATCICSTGIVSNIFSALGVSRVPLYYAPDREHFYTIINSLGHIEKQEPPAVETITFDTGYAGDVEYGTVLDPDSTMTVKINDKTTEGGLYKYSSVQVVDDPFPAKKDDKALKVNTYTYKKPDGTSDIATTATSIYADMTNARSAGNVYTFSTDFLVTKADAGCFMQLFFTRSTVNPSHSLGLNFFADKKGDKQFIRIGDGYDGPDGVRDQNIVSGIPFGEWFNLRLELYKIYTDIEEGSAGKILTIVTKIFINGEFVGTSEASYTSSGNPTVVQEKDIGAVCLATYRFNNSEYYYDNMRLEKFDKQYVETVLPPEPAPEFVATPEGERGTGEYYNALKEGTILGASYDYNNGEKKPTISMGDEAKIYLAGLPAVDDTTSERDGYVFFYRLGEKTGHEYTTHPFGQNTIPEGVENPASIAEMDMAFGNIDANLPVLLRITANGIRQNIYFTPKNGKIGFEFVAEDSKFVPLDQNKWYNFVFETYLIDPEMPVSNSNVRTKVYIDGEFAIELSGIDVASSTSAASLVIQMQYTNANSWICYDNLYLGYTEKEYVAAVEDVPEGMPTVNGTIGNGEYYNGEYEGNRHDYDNGELKPALTAGSAYGKTYLSADENRSVYFYKSLADSGENGQSYIQYTYPALPENAKGIVFEADMAFSGFSNYTSETKAAGMQFSFTFNKWLASFFIGHSDGKIILTSTSVKDGTNISLNENQWYNLRFVVYMGNEDAKTVAMVYVDGEYVGTMTPGDDKATGNSNKLQLILRQFESDDWLVYDNIYLGFTDEAYVAPEGGSQGGSGNEGGDSGDQGGTTEPTVPEAPTVTAPTIAGTKGSGTLYNGTAEGKRVDFGKISAPNVGSLATSAIIGSDYLYVKKNVAEGVTNGQSTATKQYFTTAPSTAKGHVAEFDIAFGELSSTNVQINVGAGGMLGSLYLVATDADSTVSFNSAWGNKIVDGTNIALEQGKWYNLRLVAYNVDSNITFKVYVNGEYACDVTSADKNRTDTAEYVAVVLRQLDTDNWITIDNLYLGHTDAEYVKGDGNQ